VLQLAALVPIGRHKFNFKFDVGLFRGTDGTLLHMRDLVIRAT
jgi:hypothetical protein